MSVVGGHREMLKDSFGIPGADKSLQECRFRSEPGIILSMQETFLRSLDIEHPERKNSAIAMGV
jgi:hypothetical protein